MNGPLATLPATLLWTALGFAAGMLPFAVWLPRRFAGADVRRYGDGNPGAYNAWHAGGWQVGALVLLLDFYKGALPVGLAQFGAGQKGWTLVPIGLAPILGHAFSPLLRARGGKGVTVTFGVWTGLAMPWAPIVLGATLALCYAVHLSDRWSVLLAMAALLVYIVVWHAAWPMVAVWLGNFCLLAWKFQGAIRLQRASAPSTQIRSHRE